MNTKEALLYFLTNKDKNHDKIIHEQRTIKDVFIYCIVNSISSQKYGILLEKYIMKKYLFEKNNSKDCNGDFSKKNETYELKVSIAQKASNFVQIRLNHNCNYYLLITYYLSSENIDNFGDLYIFKIKKEDIQNILIKYSTYAHGSKKNIKSNTLLHLNAEFALRPKINSELWNVLLTYRIHENELL